MPTNKEQPNSKNDSELRDWLENPLTKSFANALENRRDSILQSWGGMAYVFGEPDKTVELNAQLAAQVHVYNTLLDVLRPREDEPEDLPEDDEEDAIDELQASAEEGEKNDNA